VSHVACTGNEKEIVVADEDESKVIDLEAHRKGTEEKIKVLEKKWGKQSIDVGFTVLPAALLQGQARLKINATDLAVLIHLIEHWWNPGAMPWPKKERIAERLGVTPKTVQRASVHLEQAGLIKRNERFSNGRRTSNEYDLSPLVERLKEISADMAQANEVAKEAKEAKRSAVRPTLKRRPKTTA
jgi:predicted transcriptional regulator